MVEKREIWVKYPQGHKLRTDVPYRKRKKSNMVQTVEEEIRTNNSNNTRGDTNLKIITMITNPNEQWKLKGEDYFIHNILHTTIKDP